jgi:hypothetical protein
VAEAVVTVEDSAVAVEVLAVVDLEADLAVVVVAELPEAIVEDSAVGGVAELPVATVVVAAAEASTPVQCSVD